MGAASAGEEARVWGRGGFGPAGRRRVGAASATRRRVEFEQRRLGKTLGERTAGERKTQYFTSEHDTKIYDAELESHVDNMSRRAGQRGSHLSAKIHDAEPC